MHEARGSSSRHILSPHQLSFLPPHPHPPHLTCGSMRHLLSGDGQGGLSPIGGGAGGRRRAPGARSNGQSDNR
ncbi:hypothetical protein EYF80_041208 [Liparis tanakae]|uniref:Uncharacterized protein n=1 Tax=Liparis tanakae TaxID=230148 RepID=A0A4Z2G4Z3_9TELE|nr:hypothetical protein EYF80_041208 [Liparis tanakae]